MSTNRASVPGGARESRLGGRGGLRARGRRNPWGQANVTYLRRTGDRRFLFSPRDRDWIVDAMRIRFPSVLTDRVAQAETLRRRTPALTSGFSGRELLILGEGYWYTDDDRLVGCFQKALSLWASAGRTPGVWGEGMSPWRMTSQLLGWLAGAHCFLTSPCFDGGDVTNFLSGLTWQCEELSSWLDQHPGPRRERAAALSGLAAVGMLYPEIYEERDWRGRGLGELATGARSYLGLGTSAPEALLDGLEVYLPLLALSLKNGMEVPAEVLFEVDRVVDMLDGGPDGAGEEGAGRPPRSAPGRSPRSSPPPLLPMLDGQEPRREALIAASSLLLGREDPPSPSPEGEAGLAYLLGPDALGDLAGDASGFE